MSYPKLCQYVIGAIDESAAHQPLPKQVEADFESLKIPTELLAAAELALDPYPQELCRELGYYGLCPAESPDDFAAVHEVANKFF